MRGGTGGTAAGGPKKVLDKSYVASQSARDARFKFLSLRQRLDAVAVRRPALPPLPEAGGDSDDIDWSHYAEALGKWRELDLSAEFTRYARVVDARAANLALVYLHREDLVRHTLDALQQGFSNALAECLLALARDLGAEYHRFWLDTLESLSSPLLKSTRTNDKLWDVDQVVVPVLNVLGRIEQIVAKHIVSIPAIRDKTLQILRPFIVHRNDRFRQLVAESFAADLLRHAVHLTLSHQDREEPEFSSPGDQEPANDGFQGNRSNATSWLKGFLISEPHDACHGEVVYEACRGFQGALHSCAPHVFHHVFEMQNLPQTHVLLPLVQRLVTFVDHRGPGLPLILHEFLQTLTSDNRSAEDISTLWSSLQPMAFAISRAQPDCDAVDQLVESLSSLSSSDPCSGALQVAATLLKQGQECRVPVAALLWKERTAKIHTYLLRVAKDESQPHAIEQALHALPKEPISLTTEQTILKLLEIYTNPGRVLTSWLTCFMPDRAAMLAATTNMRTAPIVARAILTCLEDEEMDPWPAILCACGVDLGEAAKELYSWTTKAPMGPIRETGLLACSIQLRKSQSPADYTDGLKEVILDGLRASSTSEPMLCASLTIKSIEVPREITKILILNLAHSSHTVRLQSSLLMAQALKAENLDIWNLILPAVQAGDNPASVEDSRVKLSQALTLVSKHPSLDVEFLSALSYVAVGLFRTPISTIWSSASALWAAVAEKDRQAAWHVLRDNLVSTLESIGSKTHKAPSKCLAADESCQKTESNQFTKRSEQRETNFPKESDEVPSCVRSAESFWLNPGRVTDDVVLHIQLIKCITEHVNHGRRDATFMLEHLFVQCCYSCSMSLPKKKFEAVLIGYCNLIEALGGLRCLPSRHRTAENAVKDTLLRMLSISGGPVQVALVRCLTKSKAQILEPYRENLLRLADDKAFRDELTLFSSRLNKEGGDDIVADNRKEIISVVIRILVGKASTKGGSQLSRKIAVMGFFESALQQEELTEVVELFVEPLKVREDCTIPAETPLKLQEGILSSLAALTDGLAMSLSESAWQLVCQALVGILRTSFESDPATYAGRKNLRSLACQRIIGILARRGLRDELLISALEAISSAFSNVEISGDQSPALLLLVAEVCRNEESMEILCRKHQRIILHCLKIFQGSSFSAAGSGTDPLLLVAEAALKYAVDSSICGTSDLLGTLLQAIQSQLKQIVSTLWSSRRRSVVSAAWSRATRILIMAQSLARSGHAAADIATVIAAGFPSSKQKIPLVLNDSSLNFVEELLLTLSSSIRLASVELDNDTQHKLVVVFCHTIANQGPRSIRDRFAEVLSALGDQTLDFAVNVVSDAAAMRPDRVEEPDYDKRLSAFRRVAETSAWMACANSFLLVTQQCLSSSQDSDSSTRGAAGHALFVSVGQLSSDQTPGPVIEVFFSDLCSTMVECKSTETRREIGRVLGRILQRYSSPSLAPPSGLKSLLPFHREDNDPEASFFENIAHIQRHRRSRCLRRMATNLMNESIIDSHCASAFCYPLALSIVEEESDLSTNGATNTSADDLLPAAISACGAAASRMPWQQFRKALSTLIRLVKKTRKTDVGTGPQRFNAAQKVVLSMVNTMKVSEQNAEECAIYLEKHLIPALVGLVIDEDSTGQETVTFRAPMAVAAGRLLMYLPEANRDSLMTTLINPVCNVMGSRNSKLRDKARGAMVALVSVFESRYFAYLVEEVSGFLSEGFRKHVRGYSLHAMLAGCPFVIDTPALETVLRCVLDEVRGSVAQEKSVEGLHNNVREASSSKAGDMMELLGRNILFTEESSTLVLDRIASAGDDLTDRKVLSQLQELLRRLCLGLPANPSLSRTDALRFAHYVLEKYLPLCQSNVKSTTSFKHSTNAGILAEFGIDFLAALLARSFFGSPVEDTSTLAMLDPLLTLVAETGLETSRTTLTLKSLRLSQRLMKIPLSCRGQQRDKITKTVLDVLTSPNSGDGAAGELFNTCLRAASSVFDEETDSAVKINKSRAEALLLVARAPILNTSSSDVDTRLAAVSLIRAVVARKIVIAEVYDAVDAVARLGIQSQAKPLRTLCANVSLSFIMHYPLSPKRMTQHLDFYLKNLDFEYADGRLAALAALAALVAKLPTGHLETQSEYLFLPIIAKAVSDREAAVRASATDIVVKMFRRLSKSQKLPILIQMIIEWTSGASLDVKLLGITGLGLIASSGTMKKTSGREFVQLVMTQGVTTDKSKWKLCLSSLVTLEKVFTSDRSLTLLPYLQMFWENNLEALLLHPHPWIRQSSARLLGMHLASAPAKSASGEAFTIFDVAGLPRGILKASCRQLESVDLTFTHGEQISRNVTALAAVIKTSASLGSYPQNDGGDGSECAGEVLNKPLLWLIRRLAGVASREPPGERPRTVGLRRMCALRVLQELLNKFGVDYMAEMYLGIIVACIFQIMESSTPQVSYGEHGENEMSLKDIAGAMQDALSSSCGSKYYDHYNSCRKGKNAARAERKRKRAVEAVARPDFAASRKARKNAQKKIKRNENVKLRKEKRGQRRVVKPDAQP